MSELLSQKGIENYYPLKMSRPHYSGFLRTTREPLFASYVFVYATSAQLLRIKRFSEVINFVHWLGKPVIVSGEEINAIRKFLRIHSDVDVEKVTVDTDNTIFQKIQQGLPVVPEVVAGIIKIQLPSLGYVLTAAVRGELIKTTDTQELRDSEQPELSEKFAS